MPGAKYCRSKNSFLEKPYSVSDLSNAVHRILAMHSHRMEQHASIVVPNVEA